MKPYLKIISNQCGVALITMMLLLSALTMLAVGAVVVSSIDLQLASNYYQNTRAFYAAEAAVEKALSDIQSLLDGQGVITNLDLATILPPDQANFSYEQFSIVRSDSSFVNTITSGPYMGMVSLNQPIDITSRVVGTDKSRYAIMVSVEGIQIPIFQFGVFYDDSLSLHNGPRMDFIGRVHTNSSMFVRSPSNSTWFYQPITLAGDLWRFRISDPTEPLTGAIWISDPDGNWVSLTYDSGYYVGNDEGWVNQTNADFKGRLRTRAHNITPLGMPIPRSIPPISIIKQRDAADGPALVTERLDWKADLRIYSNRDFSSFQIMNRDGNPVVLAISQAVTTSWDAFYNDREHKWVDLIVIDMSRLTAGDIGNGIVYVSFDETQDWLGRAKGVKIINGATLPAPITVCSNVGLYVKGDYNTTNWQPSAVMADAVYLLSNNWSDPNNHNTDNTLTAASNTVYRVAILSGDTPCSVAAGYNGGLENFPRFLENWDGKTCRIVGSFINLYLSQNDTGQWRYDTPFYKAPIRDWWFEVNFLNFNQLPPGTPSVGSVLRIAFRQEFFE